MSKYVVQLIRKSKFPYNRGYLSSYINAMLISLIPFVYKKNSTFKIDIYIYGGCWGHLYKNSVNDTVKTLIDSTFKGLSNYKKLLDIHLVNSYKGYNFDDVHDELVKQQYKVKDHYNHSDHSKMFAVEVDNEILFLMVGSTNFSNNQYVSPDLYKSKVTDQTEVVFIKINSKTAVLLKPLISNANNNAFTSWIEAQESFREIQGTEYDNIEWSNVNESLTSISFPYETQRENLTDLKLFEDIFGFDNSNVIKKNELKLNENER
ncbi:hypothetical protein [Fructilactobacillus frigidiflavus]|uniref:hypothetical protein n=1 Tax=Fructilactobacillus frigidiflavus TaxID=3242688 RepID=UPI003756FB8F